MTAIMIRATGSMSYDKRLEELKLFSLEKRIDYNIATALKYIKDLYRQRSFIHFFSPRLKLEVTGLIFRKRDLG